VSPTVYRLSRFVCWALLRTFWRLRVAGTEHIPPRGPLIVACNHVSYFDPPALGAAATRPLGYMAKRQLFLIPLLGPLLRALGAFPVDRSRGDVAAIKAALELLSKGAAMGIFPEGTRNMKRDIKPQMGVALLASRTGAAVVPAHVSGTARVRRLARIGVAFGEPLRFESPGKATRDDLAKWTLELMRRIDALGEIFGGNQEG